MFKYVCCSYHFALVVLFVADQICFSAEPPFEPPITNSGSGSSQNSLTGSSQTNVTSSSKSNLKGSKGSGRSGHLLTQASRSSGEKSSTIKDLNDTTSLRHQYFDMSVNSLNEE